MPIRTRKLIGTFALLALVIVWALLAMAFAQFALTLGERVGRGAVLRGRRARLGAARDAAGQLDVGGRIRV